MTAYVANAAKPDTMVGWCHRLIAVKFDGLYRRGYLGRSRVDVETEQLVVRMVTENRDWGYGRIVGTLANPDHALSGEIVGKIGRRHGIAPAYRESTQRLGKGSVFVEADIFRRRFAASRPTGILGALSRGTKSSRQRQRCAVSGCDHVYQ
jgi:hypothetical protein